MTQRNSPFSAKTSIYILAILIRTATLPFGMPIILDGGLCLKMVIVRISPLCHLVLMTFVAHGPAHFTLLSAGFHMVACNACLTSAIDKIFIPHSQQPYTIGTSPTFKMPHLLLPIS